MTSQRAFWVMLGASFGLTVANMVFSVTLSVISPSALARPWQVQASGITWLAAVVLALAAGGNLLWRKRRKP